MKVTITSIKKFIRNLGRHWVERLNEEDRYSARLIFNTALPHKYLIALIILSNIFVAFFEGSTIGILTVAMQNMVGEASTSTNALGTLGIIAGKLKGNLSPSSFFFLLISMAVISQLLRSGMQYGSTVASVHLQTRVQGDMYSRVFRQIMRVSYGQISHYKIGDLTTYLNQVASVFAVIGQTNLILENFLVVTVYIGALFWLSWPTTLIALGTLIIFSSFLKGIIERVRGIAKKYIKATILLNERMIDYLQGQRIVRTFAREDYAIDKVGSALAGSMGGIRRANIWRAVVSPIMQSLTIIGVALLVIAGYVILGTEGRSAVPRLLIFIFVLYRLMPLINTINTCRVNLTSTMPEVNRVSNFMRTDDKEYMVDGGQPFTGLRQGIEFQHVSLQYTRGGESEAVKDLSFTILKGSMTALVGESGSGKTTVADLLMRLYDPTQGKILVDGADLRNLNQGQWRDHIGVVSQDTFLFSTSIRENIAFGKLDTTEEEIIAAARTAHAHEFIINLDEGYDTVVGYRGYRLSGGECQRIAIARAILRNPEILILDEATSNLDSYSERIIQEAIDNLRSERTVLIIAHRLSTVAMADQIVVLGKGKVVEQGSHTELLSRGGTYFRLWQLQSSTGIEEKEGLTPFAQS